MIRSFVFRKGELISQDCNLDFLRLVLADQDVYIWVDVEQPTEQETKALLEGVFSFHPLSIEDCVTVSERPKIDDYDSYLFMVVHAVDFSTSLREFQTNELNIFLGRDFLVTYHQEPVRCVATTLELFSKNPTVATRSTERLIYNILDRLLENYEPALDNLAGEIAKLEETLLEAPSTDLTQNILSLKTQVHRLRQVVAPQRDVIAQLARGEFRIVRPSVLPYYRDLLDRLHRIADVAETYRESLTNILQIQLNLQQNQTNRVVKVLTVLATLSLPLLVITSFYGMNIKHFPNTEWPSWPLAYLWVFAITAVTTVIIYVFLKRKNWL